MEKTVGIPAALVLWDTQEVTESACVGLEGSRVIVGERLYNQAETYASQGRLGSLDWRFQRDGQQISGCRLRTAK